MKNKMKYECGYCRERFATTLEHMNHVIEVHDTGFRKREDRLLRPISCWHCGIKDVYPRQEDGLFICEDCGWQMPTFEN
jgi:DNA-directed RNA polymerase subunit RPC12/RpoP